ncbi:MAG: SRPBCC family protein [Acidimicrobiia bacterium]|nr:SRPBCC family protein [Acidimicrobiia bacterium]
MSETSAPIHTHSDSVEIDAPPSLVWGLVTAMERYGEWSSENAGGRWRKREDGTEGTGEVGDMFVGVNRRGEDEWKAPVEVVTRDEGKVFGFVTGGLDWNIALWRYSLEPAGAGTRLTEYYELRNLSPLMKEHGQPEIDRRMANMRESIRATLEGMKAAAEAG